MNRRQFIGTTATLATITPLLANTQQPDQDKVVFCAFSDIHYVPGCFPNDNRQWLEKIVARAKNNKADFIIHCGDFTHGNQAAEDYINWYNNCGIPAYHTPGNHDFDYCTDEQAFKWFNLPLGYKFFDCKGFRFIITDTNYALQNGKYIHYTKANYYKIPGGPHVPPHQLKWLEKTIDESPYPCVITSHHSYEREGEGCVNYLDVRKIFDEANKKQPGKVRLVINGHHHHDNVRILEQIIYLDLNSASYDWLPNPHDLYPEEFIKTHKNARNTIVYNDPISAIITLTKDGHIIIDGQKSSFFLGITREMTPNQRRDPSGRTCTPHIQSIKLKMDYI